MSNPILEMKSVTKRFPGVTATDEVNLEVQAAEIVALVGENGAGKSTLMKILGGIFQPDQGSICIDGHPVTIHSVRDATSLGIAFIHQELSLLDNLDVAANVFLGREPVSGGILKLVDLDCIHAEAKRCLERLGVRISTRTLVADLSIAHRQLVEIAKALSLRARILIMDEPTSSLTLGETARLMEVVRELRSQGVSIIYITHRLGEVDELADRVVVLRDGRNVGTLAREEIDRDRIINLMVGRDLDKFFLSPQAGKRRSYLEVHNLRTRRYPEHSVSFDLRKGEILGFAGLIGAGRSEAAQAIFGVDPPLEGKLMVDGKPIQISSSSDAIAHGIYLIPEDRHRAGLFVEMTIRENVTLPSLNKYSVAGLINRSDERRSATDVCQRLRVKAGSVEERVLNLSGGNQQKVVLARWLSLNPKVLIFDEPTRGIDVGAKAEIYQLMHDLVDNGVAIMMVSSEMEEVLGVSDRVAVMHEGSITGILDRKDCSEEAIMQLAMGRVQKFESPKA